MSENEFSFRIYIVFDNRCVKQDFLTGFGFSALIYSNFTKNYLIFDTGGNAEVLLHNLKKFDIDAADIKTVIISHNHHDHAGGLDGIYRKNPNLKIFVPYEDEDLYKEYFLKADLIGVKSFKKVEKNIFSSGQFGDYIKEQALFLKMRNNKLIVLVGCTHPGLENFIIKAREISDIKAVIGGFHGFQKYSYLENIDLIGACHCTSHIREIQQRFPNQFRKVCVGTVFSF